MKRSGKLIELIAEPDNLRLAFVKARRGKTASREVVEMTRGLDRQLLQLRQEIRSGELQLGAYRRFIIREPKRREICAGPFRDNVLHHAMMNVCHPDFERHQIYDSYACRTGKGTHAAVQRAQRFSRRYAYYLKLDVRNFFASVHHVVIRKQLKRLYKDAQLLHLFNQILSTYYTEPERGLPLGNLTSQYFANHYLTVIDRYVKQILRHGGYVRYMDDLVIWADNSTKLKSTFARLTEVLESELRCSWKPPVRNRTSQGLSFLGFRIYPHYIRLTSASRQRLATKMKGIDRLLSDGKLMEKEAQRRMQSLLAHVGRADAKALRRQLLKKYDISHGAAP